MSATATIDKSEDMPSGSAVLQLVPRVLYQLKIQSRILPVEIDFGDIAWVSAFGTRLLSVCRSAIIKDFNAILEKEKGVILVTDLLAMEYTLLPSPRKDNLLIGPGFERCEIFNWKLKITIYPPNHIF